MKIRGSFLQDKARGPLSSALAISFSSFIYLPKKDCVEAQTYISKKSNTLWKTRCIVVLVRALFISSEHFATNSRCCFFFCRLKKEKQSWHLNFRFSCPTMLIYAFTFLLHSFPKFNNGLLYQQSVKFTYFV